MKQVEAGRLSTAQPTAQLTLRSKLSPGVVLAMYPSPKERTKKRLDVDAKNGLPAIRACRSACSHAS